MGDANDAEARPLTWDEVREMIDCQTFVNTHRASGRPGDELSGGESELLRQLQDRVNELSARLPPGYTVRPEPTPMPSA